MAWVHHKDENKQLYFKKASNLLNFIKTISSKFASYAGILLLN